MVSFGGESPSGTPEFSYRTRARALSRFRTEVFDLLVIGGGITGAAVARDAVSRGLKVALVERADFASGTSSRSSKLIHGGLRYLENLEFHLVFEALAERAFLLKTVPHMVRPLPFYFPVYRHHRTSKTTLSMGLWLYDLLAIFRTPEFHKNLSRRRLLKAIPFLKPEGLKGGFRYSDASMWDDVLAIHTLRSAHQAGAAVASYVEAVKPYVEHDKLKGFYVRDNLPKHPLGATSEATLLVRAAHTVVCAGPWTDVVGQKLDVGWKPWLKPSKGIHLVFDLKRIPLPGAMVMLHPQDGRVSFVIPRPDFGQGVVIVGTTDGDSPRDPDQVRVEEADIEYLMGLLHEHFPTLGLTRDDIISTYVGVRPLMDTSSESLQKVSREHFIGEGPGGATIVAGGKYTTHRRMGAEIVDFALAHMKRAGDGRVFGKSRTGDAKWSPIFAGAMPDAIERARVEARARRLDLPESLFSRYGADALEMRPDSGDPEGFPAIASQLEYSVRHEMVLKLDDFTHRRVPLALCRQDAGAPWFAPLEKILEGAFPAEAPAQRPVEPTI